MCGRFTQMMSWSDMVRHYRITEGATALNLAPRYNVAPTQVVPVVRLGPERRREIALMRWGLIPSWAKDSGVGARLINARAETLAEKPSFRGAFRHRRCLVVADGFYEWKAAAGRKQPFLIRLAAGGPFAFAGLWERWDKTADGRPVESFAIVTTGANDELGALHERMPVILAANDYDAWLDVEGWPADRAARLLGPFASGRLSVIAVSPRVNSPRHDDSGCIAELAAP